MTKKVKFPYQCKECQGDKMVQDENGDKLIKCTKCDGKGTYNAYIDN